MQHQEETEHPFYGIDILRSREKAYINSLLKKYQSDPVTEDLKAKIWDELQMEKYHGRIKIPFKVIMHRDAAKKFPDYIEVLLDTKV